MPPLQRNTETVVSELRAEPLGLTRAELVRRTGLSRPTVLAVLGPLVEAGIVSERRTDPAEESATTPGRRAEVLVLSPPPGLLVGIDFGRSHVRVAIADSKGTLIGRPLDKPCDVDAVGSAALGDAVDLATKLIADRSFGDVLAIGVGLPAPINEHGFVVSSEFLPTWATTNVNASLRIAIDERRRERAGWTWGALREDCVVRVANDASLGARAEAAHGSAAGAGDLLYVKASSSISAAFRLNGSPHLGAHRLAGELAHVAVPAEAETLIAETSQLVLPRQTCTVCGRLDCLENLASGGAIVRQLSATHAAYDPKLDIADVVSLAISDADQHPMCSHAIGFAGLRLGFVLADVIRLVDPEVIVLGGWLAKAGDIFLRPVRDAVRRAGIRRIRADVELVARDRVERSEVEGAVLLAHEALTKHAATP